jgi:hypothetical protein
LNFGNRKDIIEISRPCIDPANAVGMDIDRLHFRV